MEVSKETINRDQRLIEAAFTMQALLNKACADQAVIARIEKHLTNTEQKKPFQKVLDKLDTVTHIAGLYLDSDEELTNLSPGLHQELSPEQEKRLLKLINNQMTLAQDNVSELSIQYAACHAAARAIVIKTHLELVATIKMHQQKSQMITAEQPSHISAQDKAKNLNDLHKTVIECAQEVSDSVVLQETLRQAYAHFNLSGIFTSSQESEQLIQNLLTSAENIKNYFFSIYKKALHEILVDKILGRNKSKKHCCDHSCEHRKEKIEKCVNEISTRSLAKKNQIFDGVDSSRNEHNSNHAE